MKMTLCVVHYDVIYDPFPINSQYLKTWGVDSLVNLTPIIPQSDSSPQYFVTINCPLVSKHKMTYLAFFNSRFFSFFLWKHYRNHARCKLIYFTLLHTNTHWGQSTFILGSFTNPLLELPLRLLAWSTRVVTSPAEPLTIQDDERSPCSSVFAPSEVDRKFSHYYYWYWRLKRINLASNRIVYLALYLSDFFKDTHDEISGY